jgi:tRNA A37 methylthiotransferase MiaB
LGLLAAGTIIVGYLKETTKDSWQSLTLIGDISPGEADLNELCF